MYNLLIDARYIPQIAQGVSAASFLFYGLGCFTSNHMVAEFEHYNLAKLRTTIGALQVAAGVGLIAGYFFRPLLVMAAGGLAIMMFMAVVTRFRIRDPFYLALPATSLCILNLYILVAALKPTQR